MKSSDTIFYSVAILFLSFTFKGYNQNLKVTDTLNNHILIAAKEIMSSAKTCALITIDNEGRPRVRVMDPFMPEDDFTVWFGTNKKTRKTQQIKNNPKVTLYYLEPNNAGYVMITGLAELIDDAVEKKKHWKDTWRVFYPNMDDYILIKVSPEWMEVISYTHNIIGDELTWEPTKVQFD
jgi:general stress protein 26